MQAVNKPDRTPYRQRKVTPGRIKKIHALARNVVVNTAAWDDVATWKEEWLYPQFGITSTKQLSIAQADEVIQMLLKLSGEAVEKSSFGQTQKVIALRKLLGWDRRRLFAFIHRQFGFNKSEYMLTKQEATELIIALQRIAAGSHKEAYNFINTASPQFLSSPEGKATLLQVKNRPH